MNIINIYENYNSYFNADLKAIFELCSKIAFKHNFKLYLIGGIVRDMLLSTNHIIAPNDINFLDIDITVEGDAIEFAKLLEREANVKILSTHRDFGTVKVKFDGQKIDFASTRSEIYPKKGHLPLVHETACSLEKDVLRRDFTINSLAISLNQEKFAYLIDYVSGFEDLKAKKIRILHEKSFIDDPTRIIRALKYASRLGFELDENTVKLQQEYLENVNYDMCCNRIKNEIKKTFNQNLQTAFDKFIEQGIYKLIIKKEVESPNVNIENLVRKYKPKNPWLVYFGVIRAFEDEELLDKLEFTKTEKNIILDAKNLINKNFKDEFEIYKTFADKHIETLLILAVLDKEKAVFNYLENLQKVKLSITGKDLLKLGFSPSKRFGEGFDYVLRKKLKKPEMKKQEEIEVIKDFMAEKPKS